MNSAAAIYYTPRELEIIKLLLLSFSRKKMADVLSISPDTVKTHFNHLFLKTNWHCIEDLIIHLLSTDFTVNPERTEVRYCGNLL